MIIRTICTAIIFSILGSVFAQIPIGPEYLQRDRLRMAGDSLRFCVISDNLLTEYHKDLAMELASTQLLDADIIEVTPQRPSEPLDYRLTLNEAQIYYLLANDCEVFMGLALTNALSRWEWLLVSQPYHVSRTVFITHNEDLNRWTELPTDEPIATRIQTSGDIQLAMYLNTLQADERWRRIPYYNNQVALEQLLAGQASVGYVWEPAVIRFLDQNPHIAEFHTLPTPPLEPSVLSLGLAYRTQDAFIQSALDTAISELEELGILQELADRHKLPAQPLN